MPATFLLLAELGSIEKTVITILAVAGGFFVGAVLTHFLIRGISKFILKRQASESATRILRVVGGVGSAILVYLLLSGDGGLGLGGRGGGVSQSSREGKQETGPNQTVKESPKIKPKEKDKSDYSTHEEFFVTILNADRTDNCFYQYEKDPAVLTLSQVLQKIDQRPKTDKKLQANLVPIDPDYSYPAASSLRTELNKRGIDVIMPK